MAWDLVQVLQTKVRLPEPDLPTVIPDLDADVWALDDIAWKVRQAWGIANGPIPNVVRLLEQHGVLVLRAQLESRRVNAFSYNFGARPLVMLGDDHGDAARSRFDAAHELGHLVMHPEAEPGDGILEQQAHGFAAGFLLPARLVRDELPPRFDLREYIELRHTWGVSIAALLFRARSLGVMNDTTYRRAVTKMAASGHRTDETAFGDLGPLEQPTMLRRAVELLVSSGHTIERLADLAGLSQPRLETILGADPRPSLEL